MQRLLRPLTVCVVDPVDDRPELRAGVKHQLEVSLSGGHHGVTMVTIQEPAVVQRKALLVTLHLHGKDLIIYCVY